MSDKALSVVPSQAVAGLGELTVQAVVDRKRKIVEVMEAVMKDGEHYGRIPGCGPKPTLLKAGAEVLAMTFGLAPSFQIDRSDLANGHREYQVVCTLTHIATGAVVSQGLGCASTMESKHRWRGGARSCPECGKTTIIKGKADYGGGWLCFAKKGGCGQKWKDGDEAIEGQSTDRIENTDPADQYNTVLKMAKKRAQVDCTLTACGASDLLAQDLEDLPPGSMTVTWDRPAAPPKGAYDERERDTESAAPRGGSHDAKKKPTEDDIIEMVTALSNCGTESALEAVGLRIGGLVLDKQTRERVQKAYRGQLTEIRRVVAAEAKRDGR